MSGADPVLAASYRRCQRLTREHGTTYYWAAQVLGPARRRHVYAVYAFCRLADDLVDCEPDPAVSTAGLAALGERLFAGLAAGRSADPVLAAVVDTVLTCGIDLDCFRRFLRSMAMDLTVSCYRTWADLLEYMDGSAAVIGEMMLPVLEPLDPAALGPARDLGLAFQLTNFLRDVGEDLDRGRIYVPLEELERFGADPRARRVTPEWRAAMRYQIARNRALYATADPGIAMLPGRSARCVRAARVLYARILDRIEQNDYDVFTRRARVPTREKLAVAGRALLSPRLAVTL